MPRLDLRFANCELPFTPGVKWAATTSVGRVLAQHTARSPAVFRVLAVSASFVLACAPSCPAAFGRVHACMRAGCMRAHACGHAPGGGAQRRAEVEPRVTLDI